MKVSGFTFIRNGNILGYPFVQSIKSALPLCDEFIVAAGASDDDTLQALRAINDPKLRIIETTWNEKMIDRGYVYGQQKMIAQFNCTGDWAFYLEGDEILHESELDIIRNSMEKHINNQDIEALAFDYYHFYASPDWHATGGYRQAPRIIRNSIRSIAPDGLFFVVMDKNKQGRYPRAALTGAHIYHYGNVRSVAFMNERNQRVAKYWGKAPTVFTYDHVDPQEIIPFTGTHPAIIQPWLASDAAEHQFIPDPNFKPDSRQKRHRMRFALEKWFGLELSKKHFTLVK
ncbi:MAG: glycosyltransferase [Gallionellaceae bacterium]|jgi:glycosyltransferase involved in cell wall biosynthesis